MDFEKELERIAQEYRDEGYFVIIHPDETHLDAFTDARADLLAIRGEESVLVEVKRSRRDVAADPGIPDRAALVNSRPRWRYDLIILEKTTPLQRLAATLHEPTDEQFQGMLDRARLAKDVGLNEMALITAWAALEAAMRRLDVDSEPSRRPAPTELLPTLYANGSLSRIELDRAREARDVRNQAVHGFVPPDVDPSLIDDTLALAKKVQASRELETSPAAG